MNCRFVVIHLAATLAGLALAGTKADSICEYTGASRAKFVWERAIMADENYAAIYPKQRVMMLFDTQEGTERVLATAAPSSESEALSTAFFYMRISRSGRWLIWNSASVDLAANTDLDKTMIIDLNDPGFAPRTLLDKSTCSFWCGRAFWIDPSTGTEWIYCLNNYGPIGGGLVHGDGIYRVPLTSSGTAQTDNAEKIEINGSPYVDDVLSVSADGSKIGSAYPWPDTYILDVATGRLDLRHHDGWGCQANLAADNSYRFFHCEGEHEGIYMFDADMIDRNWFVDMNKNLAGLPDGITTNFVAPRWTNHTRFITNTFPLFKPWSGDWTNDPDQVKAMTFNRTGSFVLEKFSADFTSIESSITIAGDQRYMEYGGDGWLSSGITDGVPTHGRLLHRSTHFKKGISISYKDGMVSVHAPENAPVRARIIDAQGRTVLAWHGRSTGAIPVSHLGTGVYCITAAAGQDRHKELLSLTR